MQPWEKPRRLWRIPAWGWRSSRTELGNSASTWAWSGPASTAPSATPAVTTRSRTPPLHSCAATSDSRCLSCRSAQTLHACVTLTRHIWLQRCRCGCSLKRQLTTDCVNTVEWFPVMMFTPHPSAWAHLLMPVADHWRFRVANHFACFIFYISVAKRQQSTRKNERSIENGPQHHCPEGELGPRDNR